MALPLTTIAMTVISFALYMYIPMVIILIASVAILILIAIDRIYEDAKDPERIRIIILLTTASVTAVIFTILVYDIRKENTLKYITYRIAQKTDFVSSFNCIGIDQKVSNVLFIGPEQKRILVAPKITSEPKNHLDITAPVKVPDNFYLGDCLPQVLKSAT